MVELIKIFLPISDRMDRGPNAEMVNSSSITGWVKPKIEKKLLFAAFLHDDQQLKGQCEASTLYGRQLGR